MARFTTGTTFTSSDTVTSTKLNEAVNNAALASGSVDGLTIELDSDALQVKDGGVTFSKLGDVINDDTMATATATNLATAASVKAYIDSEIATKALIPNIVQVVKTDVSALAGSTSIQFVDIPGLEVSITPTSAGSKMMVNPSISASGSGGGVAPFFRLVRDGTNIGLGDTAGSATSITFGGSRGEQTASSTSSFSFLDSPTSVVGTPIVYKVQASSNNATVIINRGVAGNSTSGFSRSISTLTVTEVPQ